MRLLTHRPAPAFARLAWLAAVLLLPLAHAQTTTLSVTPSATYAGLPFTATTDQSGFYDVAATLDWGDGTIVTLQHYVYKQTNTHAYASAGTYTVKVMDAAKSPPLQASQAVTVYAAPTVSASPSLVSPGGTVTATLSGVHGTLTIDWGDGNTTSGASNGSYTHRYTAVGGYLIRLEVGGAAIPNAAASVVVSNTSLSMQLSPNPAQVGAPVTATVQGLPGNGSIDWGDGTTAAITGSGSYQHAYQRPGNFVAALTVSGSSTPSAQQLVTVQSSGNLTLTPAQPTLADTVTADASGLVPGYDYRLEWGDGTASTAAADSQGTLSETHVYKSPLVAITVKLLLAQQGTPTLIAVAPLTVSLPPPTESLTATQTGVDPARGAMKIRVDLSGLLPGVTYSLAFGGGSTVQTLVATADTATVTAEVFTAGTFKLELSAREGPTYQPRASTTYTAAWPQGHETLTRTDASGNAASGPAIADDLLYFRAAGLVPGAQYQLVFGTDTTNAIALTPKNGVATASRFAPLAPGPLTISLMARYPGTPGTASRASVHLTVYAPTGAIAFPQKDTVFGQPATIDLSKLVPGGSYKLAFGDHTSTTFTGPTTATLTLHHRYTFKYGPATLYLIHNGATQQVATQELPGTTFANTITPSFPNFFKDGHPTYDVTLTVGGLATGSGFSYSLDFGDNTSAPLTVGSDGTSTVDHVFAQGFGLHSYELKLMLTIGGGKPIRTFAFNLNGTMTPPTVLVFQNHFVLHVTKLTAPFKYPNGLADVSGEATLPSWVVGGREQGPLPFTFKHLDALYSYANDVVNGGHASLALPSLAIKMPLRLEGLKVTVTNFTLGKSDSFADPGLTGHGTLPSGEAFTFNRALNFGYGPKDGLILSLVTNTDGVPIGTTGWAFGGLEEHQLMGAIDMSTTGIYNLYSGINSKLLAAQEAYSGWASVNRTPSIAPGSVAWMGIVYFYTRLHLRSGSVNHVGSSYSMTAPAPAEVAWTSAGYQTVYTSPWGSANKGPFTWGGWPFTIVQKTHIDFVDSTIVHTQPAVATVHVPMFDENVPVTITPLYHNDRFGRPAYRIATAGPVAHDFGHSGVLAGQGTFQFVPGTLDGKLELTFPNAVWALSSKWASDPTKLNTTAADNVMGSLPSDGGLLDQAKTDYSNAKNTANTIINLYKLELLLNDLTFTSDGNASLGGTTWQTLLDVPALEIGKFPYLGAGAEIGVKHTGDKYGIGLKGNLSIDGMVKADVAPSWYYVSSGHDRGWDFEGVTLGYDGGDASPVSFAVTVGGAVDFQTDDVRFSGGGSLTVEKKFNIGVAGTFGQQSGTPYWFVYASTDLAKAGTPIVVRVDGAPVLAFYQFEGGVGSHLTLTTLGQGNQACRADNGYLPDGKLPSVLVHAGECVDPTDPFNFLAGTVIGYIDQSKDSATYGLLWHLKGELILNASKNLTIAGQGWTMKTLAEGVDAGAPPNLAGNFTINADAITATLCAGPTATGIQGFSCSGLQPLEIDAAGLKMVGVSGLAELVASWKDNQYYLAIGTYSSPIRIYVIPSYKSGYLVAGKVPRPGVVSPNIPVGSKGIFVNGQYGFAWHYSKSGSAGVCHYHVWADASFGFGGGLNVYVKPDNNSQILGSIDAWGNASAGGSCGDLHLSVGASIYAYGQLEAPNPFQFSGTMEVSAHVSHLPSIHVSTHATIPL